MNRDRPESYEFVRTSVMVFTLLVLAGICIYLVSTAFRLGTAIGVRSAAGILLPLVLGGFLAVFKRDLFDRASALPPSVAFVAAAGFGVVVMVLMRNVAALRAAPVAELIVAAGLTLLLYAPGSMPGISRETARSDVWMAYYFGVVSGMLVYVVFMGFPLARAL